MSPLFQAIVDKVAPPEVNADGPLQLQISALDYSSYVGVIGVGRITRGELTPNTPVAVVDREGNQRNGKVLQVMGYLGLSASKPSVRKRATSCVSLGSMR